MPFVARFAAIVAMSGGVVACVPAARGRPSVMAIADSMARAAVKNERAIDPRTFPARSVAVAPLLVTTSDTSLRVLGFGLADLLMTDLARSAQLTVVERVRLDAVLREQQLAASGRVDEATAPRTGRLVGASTIVVGEVSESARRQVSVATRLVTTASAASRGGPTSRASLDAILDAEKAIALGIFESMGVSLTPREAALVAQRPTKSLAALLAYSRGVRREANGDLVGARSEYESALRLDRSFRQAGVRATQVSQSLGEPSAPQETSRLAPLTELTVDVVNRPSIPVKSDAGDPAFTNARRLATLIITINIP